MPTVVTKTFGYLQFEGPTLRGNVASFVLTRCVVGTLKFERPTLEWKFAFIFWRIISYIVNIYDPLSLGYIQHKVGTNCLNLSISLEY